MEPGSAPCTAVSTRRWPVSSGRSPRRRSRKCSPSLLRAGRFAGLRRRAMSRNRFFASLGAVSVLLAARVFAGLDSSYLLPLEDPAIQYSNVPLSDPVTRLQQRLNQGEVKLAYDNT